MPFATQAQMADGQEELLVKEVAKRLMIEDYFCQWLMMRKTLFAAELSRYTSKRSHTALL